MPEMLLFFMEEGRIKIPESKIKCKLTNYNCYISLNPNHYLNPNPDPKTNTSITQIQPQP